MALESGTYISDLTVTNPTAGDPKSQGDDHIRLVKTTLKNTFPNVTGPVNPPYYLTTVAGTNTVTATATGLASYVAGQGYQFIAASDNTGATTLNINSIGAKAITKNGTAALVGGEIKSGYAVKVMYDGTQFQLIGIQPFAGAYTDVTASRAVNTNYTNSTGRPLFVSVAVAGSVGSSTVAASWTIGGVTSIGSTSLVAGPTPANTGLTTSAIVPPGAVYQLAVVQATLSKWHEMS